METENEMTLREYLAIREKERLDEEQIRPRVEIWPDEWSEWIASHRKDKRDYYYCMNGAKASPLCAIGIH
jgi:hypothetical protein